MSSLFEHLEKSSKAPTVGFAQVAVERGVDRYPEGLTYAVPASMADLVPGERVVVPLGRGNTPSPAWVLSRHDTTDLNPRSLKTILSRPCALPPLPGDLLELCLWMSRYTVSPVGIVASTMLPAAVKRGTGSVLRELIDISPTPPPDARPTKKQQQVLDVLEAIDPASRPVELKHLSDEAGLGTTGPIRRLIEKGWLTTTQMSAIQADWSTLTDVERPTPPPTPTPAQQKVIESITSVADTGFSTHLLHGVTGSGKTEVYLRLIDAALEQERRALMLVPEIALTPQVGGRLMRRFPDRKVGVLHSGLTAAQRHQQWMMIATGEVDIVLGARSGVFAPFPEGSLGVIIIDEEHDSSYKQDQSPRYHARAAAIVRASINACPIVLGSATPSMESWHNATVRDDWTLHRLPDRAPGLTTPTVRIIDRVQERRAAPRHRGVIGPTLHTALLRTLDKGLQSLILLNRRGWASYVACASPACGWMLRCDRCDATMVVHRLSHDHSLEYLRCHHCQQERRRPTVCEACGGRCTTLGSGTQRIESDLHALDDRLAEPGAVVRVDSDTMRRSTDYHRVLAAFGAGETRVLLGTQMIAKGLDYPGIGLVGVVDADTSINLPDFRAAERTYQLISQVTGRCGRGEDRGVAIVQTWNPDLPAVALAARGEYEAFASEELAQREACGLPPMTRMARIVVRDRDESIAQGQAGVIAELCSTHPAVTVLGPSPCAMSKVADHYRYQVELTAATAGEIASVLAAARREDLLTPPARVAVDVDPIFLM